MRDPIRIPIVLDKLREVWEKHPELRLLQLLHAITGNHWDPYYIEDDELIAMIERFLAAPNVGSGPFAPLKFEEVERDGENKGV